MSCFFDGFYENILTLCRKPLEEPKPQGEIPRIAGIKGEVKITKEKEKVDPTERLKKAIQKEIKIKPKKVPPIRVQKEDFIKEQPTKLDSIIKHLINEAEDTTIDKLFNIIVDKLDGENLMIKNIKNKRKFIINLL